MTKTAKGWAIDPNRLWRGKHLLIGKYWWFGGRPQAVPTCMGGYSIAVFATRREARAALVMVRAAYPQAKVVRVRIEIIIED